MHALLGRVGLKLVLSLPNFFFFIIIFKKSLTNEVGRLQQYKTDKYEASNFEQQKEKVDLSSVV